MAMSRGGMGKETAGARLKKRTMGASRQGKKTPEAMMPAFMNKGGSAKKKFATGGAVTNLADRNAGAAQRAARDASFGSSTLARLQGIVAARGATPARTAAIGALTKNPNMTREQFANARQAAKPVPPVRPPNQGQAPSAGPGSPANPRTFATGAVKKAFADGGAVVATSLPSDPRLAARMNRLAARGKFSDTPNPNPINPVTGRPGRGGSPPQGGTMMGRGGMENRTMGLKDGGMVSGKKTGPGRKEVVGPAPVRPLGMKKGGMAAAKKGKAMKKGGMALMIVLGAKKGKK